MATSPTPPRRNDSFHPALSASCHPDYPAYPYPSPDPAYPYPSPDHPYPSPDHPYPSPDHPYPSPDHPYPSPDHPYPSPPSSRPLPAIIIRRLAPSTTPDALASMLLFAHDLRDTDFIPSPYPEDLPYRTAVARFTSPTGAIDAQQKLHGKPNSPNALPMMVEIHHAGPPALTWNAPAKYMDTYTDAGKYTINHDDPADPDPSTDDDDQTSQLLRFAGLSLHAPPPLHTTPTTPLELPPPRPQYPPVNPADKNPACNTLYVGNLPPNTHEDELKAIFSSQRGYRRLCFSTKHNGPMCFVEFDDVGFATKALHDLYGRPLHNSVKGGMRLSFSKNPLGVRSPPASAPATPSTPLHHHHHHHHPLHHHPHHAFSPSLPRPPPPPGLTPTNPSPLSPVVDPFSQSHDFRHQLPLHISRPPHAAPASTATATATATTMSTPVVSLSHARLAR